MACNSSNCQSNCYKNRDEEAGPDSNPTPSSRTTPNNINGNSLCVKCKINDSVSGSGVGDEWRQCADCFRSNLFGKFRQAVTCNTMISPTDNVLVAFSGGTSSRVALQFVHEMQHKALKNFEASRDRSLPVIGVGVAFVDESAACSVSPDKVDGAIQDIRLVVSSLALPKKELHVVPIENIYTSNYSDRRSRLKSLLNAVSDATGKEDLLLHLRMLSLQKIAIENGYNKLVLGSCTSRIACRVISSTVKGQGYSLPADIQYVDARWEVPVLLPLRDCLAQELNMLCRLDGLKTVELIESPRSSINNLVSSFVTLLQEENPSRESTIMRTAGKLTPFQFNRIPEIKDCNNVPLAKKRFSVKSNESISSESFCPICNSPLNKSDLKNFSSPDSLQASFDLFESCCCSSCRFQILPKGPTAPEHFYSLLPQPLISRAENCSNGNLDLLREQIQEFLLSDNEAE